MSFAQPVATGGGFNVPTLPEGGMQRSVPAPVPTPTPAPAPNGDTFALPGQVPGFVPRPPAGAEQPAPAAPVAPAQTLDAAQLQQLVQQALQGVQAQPKPVQDERPGWLPESLARFDPSTIQDPMIANMAGILRTAAGTAIDLDRAVGRALQYGDPALVDVQYIAEKGGANAKQIAELAQGIVKAVNLKSESITASIHASVGGEAQWSVASAAFNKTAPAELKLTVRQMLDSTNENLIKAGAKIVADFAKGSGVVPQPGVAAFGANAAAAPGGQALSKAQFQAELSKLKQSDPGYSQARADLFSRRSLGKAAGL